MDRAPPSCHPSIILAEPSRQRPGDQGILQPCCQCDGSHLRSPLPGVSPPHQMASIFPSSTRRDPKSELIYLGLPLRRPPCSWVPGCRRPELPWGWRCVLLEERGAATCPARGAPVGGSSTPAVPLPTQTCGREAGRLLLNENEALVRRGARGKPRRSRRGMTVQTAAEERLSHFLPQSPK